MILKDTTGREMDIRPGQKVQHGRHVGTVLIIKNDGDLGIEMGDDFSWGHSLGGVLRGSNPKGYWINANMVKFLDARDETVIGFCPDCLRPLTNEAAETYGGLVCVDCLAQYTVVCTDCGMHIRSRHVRQVDGNRIVCPRCANSNYDTCIACRTRRKKTDMQILNGHYVCTACMGTAVEPCSHCHRPHFKREMFKYGKKRLCYQCRESLYPTCRMCHRRHTAAHTTQMDVAFYGMMFVCNRCKDLIRTCGECGRNVMSQDAHTQDSVTYCDECFERKYFRCVNCREIHLRSDAVRIPGTFGPRLVCATCSAGMSRCPHCNSQRFANEMRTVTMPDGSTQQFCNVCVSRMFEPCSGCGNVVHRNMAIIRGGRFCEQCAPMARLGLAGCKGGDVADWKAPRNIQSYCYKPNAIMFPKIDTEDGIYYGFELETDRTRRVTNPDHDNAVADHVCDLVGYCYGKSDGSLNNGIEFVTHPATIEYHTKTKRAEWSEAMQYLRSQGYTGHSNETCGLHVHVSSVPLETKGTDTIEKIIYLWDKFWDQLVRFSRRTSRGLGWSKKMPININHNANDGEVMRVLKSVKGGVGDRYVAVNLIPRFTIEFRLFRSTLIPETLFAALQLVDVLVRAAIKYSFSDLRKMTWEEVTASDYPELKAYMESRNLLPPSSNALESDADNTTPRVTVTDPIDYTLAAA